MRRPLVAITLLAVLTIRYESFCSQAMADQGSPSGQAGAAEATANAELMGLLATPRQTVETFITRINEGNPDQAAVCLDLSAYNSITVTKKGPRHAAHLKEIIDRMRRVDYERIPDDADAESPYQLGHFLGEELLGRDKKDAAKIYLERGNDGLWRFSSTTVAAIEALWLRWEEYEELSGLSDSLAREPFDDWFKKLFPSHLQRTYFLLPTYKWIYLLGLTFVGFLADLLVRLICTYLTSAWLRYRKPEEEKRIERKLWKPIGLLAQALIWFGGASLIDLPDLALTILLAGLKVFAVIAGVWTGFMLINLMVAYLARKAEKTESKFDDLLVPLVSKSLKIFVSFVGILTCANAFNLPMAGLLGGTAIGGMALALASQDAVGNLFGSLTVLIDRPFEIGDWIVTGDVEGTVETVGFRSTRIRTFYNSQMTVPNSNLTTAIVDNMGRRRYRRIKAMLGVQYDTTPEQIEAFCEGIRELLRRHPYTRKDYYHVYFNGYGDSALNILLYCFVDCADWSVELREKHRLFVDILKLAKELGISFAFPTRTLHMFQQEQTGNGATFEMDYPERSGRRLAAGITGPPKPLDERPGPVEFRGPTSIDEKNNEDDE